MFSRHKLKKRQSQAPPPQASPEPVVYELPPIGSLPKSDFTDLSPDATLKSSAASIRSESKAPVRAAIPQFHKPSRLQTSGQSPTHAGDLHIHPDSIASLYSRNGRYSTASDMTAVTLSQQSTYHPTEPVPRLPKSPSMQIHKRQRLAPTFNLAVIGPRKTGKTSFIRSLISKCELAHRPDSVAGEQDLKRLMAFGSRAGGNGERVKSTEVTDSLSLEVLDGRGDRLALTCVDSPGWAKDSLGEMKAEMVVNNFIKSCELRFASSLESENAVHRTSARPDSHIHCVLYFIDPDTFVWSSSTPASDLGKLRYSKSASNIHRTQSVKSKAGTSDTNDLPSPGTALPQPQQPDSEELLPSTLDLRMIKKISKRATVVPVIAKADTLTRRQLREVKDALNRDLKREGLDYGVLEPVTDSEVISSPTNGHVQLNGSALDDSEEQPPQSPHSIPKSPSAPHLGTGLPLQRSRSRHQSLSRKRRTILNDPEAAPPPTPSTATLAQHLPFALVAPETLPVSQDSPLLRDYPWGSVHVTNPDHSDFGLVLQSLVHHHLRSFREATRGFYEAYRTEQLVNRRLTQASAVSGQPHQ